MLQTYEYKEVFERSSSRSVKQLVANMCLAGQQSKTMHARPVMHSSLKGRDQHHVGNQI